MSILKVNSLNDLRNIKGNYFIVNLECANNHDRKNIMYFLSGLTFDSGCLKKLSAYKFLVKCK